MYICQTCGADTWQKGIGAIILDMHMTFCSEECLDEYKTNLDKWYHEDPEEDNK